MNNLSTQQGDLHKIVTFDGNELVIPSATIYFNSYGGYGAPPVEFVTRRGYKQHGVTEIDFFLQPRTISVNFYQQKACSRIEYWQFRYELHEFLRHNRNGPITFILRQPDGEQRALTVRANPGAVFAPLGPDINSWNLDEPLDFIAFDPVWFDPVAVDQSVTRTVDSHLVFPITFPIQFGVNGAQFNYIVTYAGTWKTYPIMTLTGPYQSAEIRNTVTGVTITMVQAVNAGETRIIDLTPGDQSVVDGNGVNKFTDLGTGSNLVDFNIRPDPEVAGGVQTIQAILRGEGAVLSAGFNILYYARYFAI